MSPCKSLFMFPVIFFCVKSHSFKDLPYQKWKQGFKCQESQVCRWAEPQHLSLFNVWETGIKEPRKCPVPFPLYLPESVLGFHFLRDGLTLLTAGVNALCGKENDFRKCNSLFLAPFCASWFTTELKHKRTETSLVFRRKVIFRAILLPKHIETLCATSESYPGTARKTEMPGFLSFLFFFPTTKLCSN